MLGAGLVLPIALVVGVIGLVFLVPALDVLVRRALFLHRSEVVVGTIVMWDPAKPIVADRHQPDSYFRPLVKFRNSEGYDSVARIEPPQPRRVAVQYPAGSTYCFRYRPGIPTRGFDLAWNASFKEPGFRAVAGGLLVSVSLLLIYGVSAQGMKLP